MSEPEQSPDPVEMGPRLVEADTGDPPQRPATALERTRLAVQRDEAARRRDLSAVARDRSADARDRSAARRESTLPTQDADRRVKRALSGLRAAAAQDREDAAANRRQAAADRAAAAADRRQARVDLARAHLDDLTGVLTRDLGREVLRNEVSRAHREHRPFTLAFLDVDDLKGLNDSHGHAAGDAFLRAVADAIRHELRSYDPVARMGGDEFVCGFVGTATDAAVRRIMEVRDVLAEGQPDRSFSVGIAELESGETLEQLLERGDHALYRAKRGEVAHEHGA